MISTAYAEYIANFKALRRSTLPVTKIDAVLPKVGEWPKRMDNQHCALLLSPHPDDECLMGALPLRLSLEDNWQIINVAVTLGSKQERRQERLVELSQACAVVGFDLLLPAPEAFTNVRKETKDSKSPAWGVLVGKLAKIIRDYWPEAIIIPHGNDGHYTHVGTHLLALDALASMPPEFACHLIQTEYWQPLANPNLMVGLSDKDATTLLTALCCHGVENNRNPFHLRFPSFLSDNVRRGSELLDGAGSKASDLDFAMLYRLDSWKDKKVHLNVNKRIIYPEQAIQLDCAEDIGI